MAKVRLLAVLTIDGCPAETTMLSGSWLDSDKYGIGALKEEAVSVLDENMSLISLSNRTEHAGDSLIYIIEATASTAGIINGMMRMRLRGSEVYQIGKRLSCKCIQSHDDSCACFPYQ